MPKESNLYGIGVPVVTKISVVKGETVEIRLIKIDLAVVFIIES